MTLHFVYFFVYPCLNVLSLEIFKHKRLILNHMNICINRNPGTMNVKLTCYVLQVIVPKVPEVAPWARDSSGEDNDQSDSENQSHHSGESDSVFSSSDKSSTPNKVLSDDDSWKNKNLNSQQQIVPKQVMQVSAAPRSGDKAGKRWENNVGESQKKDSNKKVEIPGGNNSAKIKNITQAFEQKDKEANAEPVIHRRRSDKNAPAWRSLDLSDSKFTVSNNDDHVKSPLSPLSPTTPKALIPRDQRFGGSRDTAEEVKPQENKVYIYHILFISVCVFITFGYPSCLFAFFFKA